MKIAFFGLPLAALLLAADGHEIVWAAICRRGALGTRRLKKLTTAYVVPDLEKKRAEIAAASPELIVSWFWTKKVPPSVLSLAPAIGVHPSLLPRHRGADPYFWAIDAGDEKTGVTAHRLEAEYDTGDLLGARELAIDPTWNAWRLAKRLDRPSLALLRDTVKRWPVKGARQDESHATAAPNPTDDDLEIRWSLPSARIARRIRAASPWPGAFTELGGETVILTRVAETNDFPKILEPGQAFVRKDGTAVVRTGDTALELREGRFDDDERVLDGADLAEIVEAAREIEE